jgi:hypothetical protein
MDGPRSRHSGLQGKFGRPSFVAFPSLILEQMTEPLFLVQDGVPYHLAALVKACVEPHRDRLHATQLPSDSPTTT